MQLSVPCTLRRQILAFCSLRGRFFSGAGTLGAGRLAFWFPVRVRGTLGACRLGDPLLCGAEVFVSARAGAFGVPSYRLEIVVRLASSGRIRCSPRTPSRLVFFSAPVFAGCVRSRPWRCASRGCLAIGGTVRRLGLALHFVKTSRTVPRASPALSPWDLPALPLGALLVAEPLARALRRLSSRSLGACVVAQRSVR